MFLSDLLLLTTLLTPNVWGGFPANSQFLCCSGSHLGVEQLNSVLSVPPGVSVDTTV